MAAMNNLEGHVLAIGIHRPAKGMPASAMRSQTLIAIPSPRSSMTSF